MLKRRRNWWEIRILRAEYKGLRDLMLVEELV